jgi:uncharacterized membrane protein
MMAPEQTELPPAHEQSESQPPHEPKPGEKTAIEQTEMIISGVLRGGVLVSAAVIGIGVVDFYARYASAGRGISDTPFPHTIAAVITGLGHGDPLAVVALGLLILLATPFTRVAVSILAFAVERDWVYTAITVLVLLILIISFVLGQGGA